MIDLWAHQQDAVDKLGPLGAGYLALDMGCGKSRTALALGVDVWKCRRILVLCPKSVVAVWPKEFAKCGLEDWMILPLDAGTVAERAERAEAGFLCAEIDGVGLCVVLNYESTIREPMASTLARLPWDLAIYDEAHRIKGADGKQSQVARAIARGVPHRLCLSGTPMPHSLLDLFPQFEVVDSSILGTDWWAFRRHHVVSKEDAAREKARGYGKKRLDELNALQLPLSPGARKAAVMRFGEDALACKERVGTVKPTAAALEALGNRRIDDLVRENPWWRTAVERYQNEDELQAKIEPHMCRVMTRDVMDLPPVTHLERLCLLGAKARRAHEQAEQELRVEIGDGKGVDTACVFSKLTRCAQISNGFLPVTDDDGNREIVEVGREKAELLAEVLADLPTDEPVAIFSWFIEDLRIIGEVCEKAGRPYLQHGGDRSEMGRWQAGEGNVLGVQIQKGGVGVDLTRARYQVYYSVTFNLGDYEQSLKRLDRPGLRDHLFVVHLLAAGTVDERVYAALANRQEIVGAVMDGLARESKASGRKRRTVAA